MVSRLILDPAVVRLTRGATRPGRGLACSPATPPVRPNHLGVSRCALLDIAGLVLTVRGLDAIDGIRILDIKPDTTGFRPHGRIREPAWMRELMADYY